MLDGYFSNRYRLRPQSTGLIYEQVPESARAGLYQILDDYFQNGTLSMDQLYCNVSHALHIEQERMDGKMPKLPKDTHKAIEKLIMECEWWQFYDICEVIPRSLSPHFNNNMMREECHGKINKLFTTEKLGFEVTKDGLVEKINTNFTDASIKNTRYLVKDPGFKEAGELFESVLQEIYYKAQPDLNMCINNVLLAIESVAKVVSNGNGKLSSFNEIITSLTEEGLIPRQINEVIRNTYLLIGDRERMAYGMNGSTNIGADEAEFVLALAAAMITYLVTKKHQFGNDTQDLNDNHLFIEYQPATRK